MTFKEFINRHRITADVNPTDSNPNMEDFKGYHYSVKLKHGRKSMLVPFSVGYGWDREPTVADVLECMQSDISGSDESFENWCANLGYDSDSRKAEKIYKAVQSQSKRLLKLLGPAAWADLLECES